MVDLLATSTIETLAKQMQELQFSQMHQIQELQPGQANILWKLAALKTAGSNAALAECRCFICDKPNAHRLGIYNCPEVYLLINKGLADYSPDGQLTCANGGTLPCSIPGEGVTKALWDEQLNAMASSSEFRR